MSNRRAFCFKKLAARPLSAADWVIASKMDRCFDSINSKLVNGHSGNLVLIGRGRTSQPCRRIRPLDQDFDKIAFSSRHPAEQWLKASGTRATGQAKLSGCRLTPNTSWKKAIQNADSRTYGDPHRQICSYQRESDTAGRDKVRPTSEALFSGALR